MNICVQCKHIRRKEPQSPRGACDYNITCAAVCPVSCLDPVLGVEGWGRVNDLGGFVFCRDREDAYPTCRSVNPNGECKLFAQR